MKAWKKITIWSILWIMIIMTMGTKYSWVGLICALPFGIVSMINVEF